MSGSRSGSESFASEPNVGGVSASDLLDGKLRRCNDRDDALPLAIVLRPRELECARPLTRAQLGTRELGEPQACRL